MGTVIKRFDICLVNVDPTIGKEIKNKTLFSNFSRPK
jgi:mRNA-degrading endonuclease toxin of MazEF toxin-antitoxin module